MLSCAKVNLLEADVAAVVKTVNTVGVMGKGIALMVKEAFPKNFSENVAGCKRGEVQVGRMFVTETGALIGPKWVINFPTKKHWRQRAKLQWIVDGLTDLRKVVEEKQIRSIAVPPLGCSNGSLDLHDVCSEIESALDSLENSTIIIYETHASLSEHSETQ